MGEELADQQPDFSATGSEWRTAQLWGIGMIRTVNRHTYLLHDGRARNIEKAICGTAVKRNARTTISGNFHLQIGNC